MPQCEGYRRHGGAFTLGPVRWEQCSNDATVMLHLIQDGKEKTFPACPVCWNEALENGDQWKIKVLNAKPIMEVTDVANS